jgi:sialate O-acetylesterase
MAASSLSFHALISDHAVLQRDTDVPVYGVAPPGARVEVTLDDERAEAVADSAGRWEVTFAPRPAGGAHRISATSAAERVEARDVTFGEVWLASGQSNMEWTLVDTEGAADEIAAASDPNLRVFTVPRVQGEEPTHDCAAHWQPATSSTAGNFSAVAYFFAKALRSLDVPVGMLVSAWGGTRIASWIAASDLDPGDAFAPPVEDIPYEVTTEPHVDPGNSGHALGYASADLDDTDWELMPVPSYWQDHGHFCNGAAWYRRQVEVPDAWVGRELVLDLGAVDDFDQTYFNGVPVGAIGPENPAAYAAPRRYRIDATLVKKSNTVAVRAFDHWGQGGFAGPAGVMQLSMLGAKPLPLAGIWRFRFELELPWRRGDGTVIATAALYNAMIHPLTRSRVRGAVWYQGESDTERAERYRVLLSTLVQSWRSRFNAPNLAFGVVQLPAYKQQATLPLDDDWAELREAQRSVLELAHTGLAVTLDLGDAVDIHPRRKRPVGERLGWWALAKVYGRPIAYSGPVATSHRIDGAAIVVRFDHAEGLRARDGARLSGFQIAGSDRGFVWAPAVIDGDSVRVSHPDVPEPVAVRYAWSANPAANLENGAGLLASPFRTDRWPGVTAGVF